MRSLFGVFRGNPKLDLDEATLKSIAAITGGRYFRARDSDELNQIYRHIDAIEPIESDARRYRPVSPLFTYPLIVAWLISVWCLWRIGRRLEPHETGLTTRGSPIRRTQASGSSESPLSVVI